MISTGRSVTGTRSRTSRISPLLSLVLGHCNSVGGEVCGGSTVGSGTWHL